MAGGSPGRCRLRRAMAWRATRASNRCQALFGSFRCFAFRFPKLAIPRQPRKYPRLLNLPGCSFGNQPAIGSRHSPLVLAAIGARHSLLSLRSLPSGTLRSLAGSQSVPGTFRLSRSRSNRCQALSARQSVPGTLRSLAGSGKRRSSRWRPRSIWGCGEPPRQVPHVPRATFCYGGRSENYLACINDFEWLGVEVQIATDDGSRGRRGFVTELLGETLTEARAASCQSCVVC
jgi:hypothetical protein